MKQISVKPADSSGIRTADMAAKTLPARKRAGKGEAHLQTAVRPNQWLCMFRSRCCKLVCFRAPTINRLVVNY